MALWRVTRATSAVVAVGALVALGQPDAYADRSPTRTASPEVGRTTGPDRTQVPTADRDALLGPHWRESTDLAWTTIGDGTGLHLLTGRQNDGYHWTTTATLAEPGFDADTWIGNACVTGSGRRAAVVYAPRTFTNRSALMARGGFTAVVDLTNGAVTKLALRASLSYYSPGCGPGETVVFTQSPGEDRTSTRLVRVDTSTGTAAEPIEVGGQVTSAVVTQDGTLVGAAGAQVVRISGRGEVSRLARTEGVPYRLTPDRDGGLTFLDRRGDTAHARRLATAARESVPTMVAAGPRTAVGLTGGAGTVYVTGDTTATGTLPRVVRRLAGTSKDATVSTGGAAVVNAPSWAGAPTADLTRPVGISLTVTGTRRGTTFTVDPAARRSPLFAQGRAPSPALTSRTTARTGSRVASLAASSPTDPVEEERTCSVPRNDPRNQAMQPKPRQVEWAVDQAVTGFLNTHVSRPANWKNLGMPAYSPQSLFLNPALDGGGRVPAQVLLGLATQESNMWQAARSAVPGVTANPLIGNFYGIDLYDGQSGNDWDVDFAEADCGYGITQVTDHMRLAGREDGHGGTAWDYQKQRAVALDYTANISAGLQILITKWNETRAAGLVANNGDPAKLENWFYALWAYNSGFHANAGDGTPWGLGWTNNPANPEWDAGRLPFMENALGGEDASAAARPQNWPYPEKVLGFAAHPPAFIESPGTMVPAFRAATWNGSDAPVDVPGSALANRAHVKPDEDLFCDSSNTCDPDRIGDDASNDSASSGPCGREDFRCWWHKPVTWKTACDLTCGNEFMRFNSSYPEEADGTAYPPVCTTTGLPANARIVDDVAEGTPVIRPGCTNSTWSNAGTFSFTFANNGTETSYPSKVDTHQLGAGFGGHFYFSHTRTDDAKGQRLKVTGTWTFRDRIAGLTEVYVHLPDHGAQTSMADYEIETAYGTQIREIDQRGDSNRWVSLGQYRFREPPRVRLSTITRDGTGDDDIAFDAVAVVPVEPDAATLPDIMLPPANPAAPDIDYTDGGPPMDISGFPAPAGQRTQSPPSAPSAPSTKAAPSTPSTPSTKAAQPARCGPVDGPKKRSLCVSVSGSQRSARSTGTTAASSLVPWCDTLPGEHMTRFEACLWETLDVTLLENGTPVGSSVWLARQQIQHYPNEASFNQMIFLEPITMDPQLVALTVTLSAQCVPTANCNTTLPNWQGATTWPAGDRHVSSVIFSNQWRVGSTNDNTLLLGWTLTFASPAASNPATYAWGNSRAEVRCDRRASGSGFNSGCVFPHYTPTFTVNTAKHPTASAMYWVLRERLPGRPGSRAADKPLHREIDKATRDANRAKLCPDSYVRDPGVPKPTCDEYPFAATKESGGSSIGSGDDCAQFVGPQKADGSWELKADPRYPIPTWSEVCGRGTITADHNEGAGSDLGVFYNAQRLLDNDPFFVETPGFDNCTSVVCDIRI